MQLENTLTAAEINRRGLVAIEEALQRGPVVVVEGDRRAAVVLSNQDYQRLAGATLQEHSETSAIQWLLALPTVGSRARSDIDIQLHIERGW